MIGENRMGSGTLDALARFAATVEAIREVVDTTPRSKVRLGPLSIAAVSAARIRGIGQISFAWLLPALAFTLVILVLLTRLGTRTIAPLFGPTWLTDVITLETRGAVLAALPGRVQAGVIVTALPAATALGRQSSTRIPIGNR